MIVSTTESRECAAEISTHPFGQVVDAPNPHTILGRLKALADALALPGEGLTDAQLRRAAVAVSAAALPLPAGAATEATLAAILAKMIASPATETTLAAILTKLIAAPATEAGQTAVIARLGGAFTTRRHQRAFAAYQVTLSITGPTTILTAAQAAGCTGARVVNRNAFALGLAFDATSGVTNADPFDYLPAAVNGIPGQLEPGFAPIDGMRVSQAPSAGTLTVEVY